MGLRPGIGRVTTTCPTSRSAQPMTGNDALATTSDARNLHAENDTPAGRGPGRGWVAVGSRWSATRARTAKELAIGRDRCCVVRTDVAALAIGDNPDRMALPQGLAPWVLALPIVLYGTGLFLLTIAAGVTSIATTSLSIGTRGRLSLAR